MPDAIAPPKNDKTTTYVIAGVGVVAVIGLAYLYLKSKKSSSSSSSSTSQPGTSVPVYELAPNTTESYQTQNQVFSQNEGKGEGISALTALLSGINNAQPNEPSGQTTGTSSVTSTSSGSSAPSAPSAPAAPTSTSTSTDGGSVSYAIPPGTIVGQTGGLDVPYLYGGAEVSWLAQNQGTGAITPALVSEVSSAYEQETATVGSLANTYHYGANNPGQVDVTNAQGQQVTTILV